MGIMMWLKDEEAGVTFVLCSTEMFSIASWTIDIISSSHPMREWFYSNMTCIFLRAFFDGVDFSDEFEWRGRVKRAIISLQAMWKHYCYRSIPGGYVRQQGGPWLLHVSVTIPWVCHWRAREKEQKRKNHNWIILPRNVNFNADKTLLLWLLHLMLPLLCCKSSLFSLLIWVDFNRESKVFWICCFLSSLSIYSLKNIHHRWWPYGSSLSFRMSSCVILTKQWSVSVVLCKHDPEYTSES